MSNSNIKILLVDDEPDIVEFLGYNLKKEGYEVLSASNGKDAVEIAKKEFPSPLVSLNFLKAIMTHAIRELKNESIPLKKDK